MPELPEVETIRRDLEQKIAGRRITGIRIPPDSGKPVPVLNGITEADFREAVIGARIEAVRRRGKFLVFVLDSGAFMVVHLRMTGALLHRNPEHDPDKYVRAVLSLDDGMELRFSDLRKFGGFWLLDSLDNVSDGLGPEPLEEGFSEEVLVAALKDRKAPVKSIILDQRRIAGIGNIYADEALFESKIDGRRLGKDIASEEVSRLHKAIRSVLLAGVESRGASFSDYRDADGNQGNMQMHVQVFR